MIKFIYSLIPILLFTFSSCQKSTLEKKEKRLRVCYHVNPATIDPRKSGDIVSSCLIFNSQDGLLRLQPDGTFIPALAEKYEISEDGLQYRFVLREAYWSDGTPITAEDFAYTWKTALSKKIPCLTSQLFYPIKNAEKIVKGELSFEELGVRAIDDRTLVVNLESPAPHFISLISFCNFFPIPSHIDKENSTWDHQIDSSVVCSGAFIFDHYTPNKEVVLKKNPNYWNAKNVQIDTLHISIIPDPNTSLQLYDMGELDIVGSHSLPKDAMPTLLQREDLCIFPMGGCAFVTFNVNRFPFTNKNIRKAFTYAMDRKSITESITRAKEKLGTQLIPPVMVGDKLREVIVDNQPELAKRYFQKGLEELGINKEEIGTIVLSHVPSINKEVAMAIIDTWQKNFGIKVQFEGSDFKTAISKLYQHRYQVGLVSFIAQYNDPMNTLDLFKFKNNPKNYPGWEDPTYVSLLNKTNLAANNEERLEVFREVEDFILEEAPIAPIYHFNSLMLVNPRVKNFGVPPAGYMRFDQVKLEL